MRAIYEREVHEFFCTMIGYVYTAFMLLIIGLFFTAYNLQSGVSEFGYTLGSLTMVLLIVIPILTMRTLGEERRQKTDQLLFTAPVRPVHIVLGKFGAVFTVFSLPIAVAALCPLVLTLYGTVPLAVSYICFVPFLFMGAACIAIGMFISSLTENQILTAVETFGVLLLSYLIRGIDGLIEDSAINALAGFALVVLLATIVLTVITKNRLLGLAVLAAGEGVLGALYLFARSLFTNALSSFLEIFSLFSRYYDFVDGVFDVTHLVYYASVTLLFLFLTVQSLEIRRWR